MTNSTNSSSPSDAFFVDTHIPEKERSRALVRVVNHTGNSNALPNNALVSVNPYAVPRASKISWRRSRDFLLMPIATVPVVMLLGTLLAPPPAIAMALSALAIGYAGTRPVQRYYDDIERIQHLWSEDTDDADRKAVRMAEDLLRHSIDGNFRTHSASLLAQALLRIDEISGALHVIDAYKPSAFWLHGPLASAHWAFTRATTLLMSGRMADAATQVGEALHLQKRAKRNFSQLQRLGKLSTLNAQELRLSQNFVAGNDFFASFFMALTPTAFANDVAERSMNFFIRERWIQNCQRRLNHLLEDTRLAGSDDLDNDVIDLLAFNQQRLSGRQKRMMSILSQKLGLYTDENKAEKTQITFK